MQKLKDKKVNIILAGEGGQGVQTIAKSLTDSAISCGYYATYLPSFGVEQRGAPSVAFVIISPHPISYPRFTHSDLALIMSSRSINSVKDYITLNTELLFDSSKIKHSNIKNLSHHIKGIPATKYASLKFHPRSYNLIFYGKVTAILGLNKEKSWKSVYNALKHKFSNKSILNKNKDAFEFGREAVLEQKNYSSAEFDAKKRPNLYSGHGKKAIIDPKYCKGCGICIEKCPVGALSYGEDLGVFSTPVPTIDLKKCIACGNCQRFCPDGAIGVKKVDTLANK